jgi:hypothetical protein
MCTATVSLYDFLSKFQVNIDFECYMPEKGENHLNNWEDFKQIAVQELPRRIKNPVTLDLVEKLRNCNNKGIFII